MSTTTTNKRILVSGAPFAWLFKIAAGTEGTPDVPGTITELWRFDNLADISVKINLPSAAAATGEKITLNVNDGTIWQWNKCNVVMDALTETDVTPSAASADATGLGEVTIITNEAPLPVTIVTPTEWLEDIQDEFDSLFMLVVPTGFTLDSRDQQKLVDGYVYLICKLSTGIDLKLANAPATISLTFISYKCTLLLVTTAIIEAATFTGIVHKGKGDTYIPEDLEAGDGALLMDGKVIFKPSATYTYTA